MEIDEKNKTQEESRIKRTIDIHEAARFANYLLLFSVLILVPPFLWMWWGKITYSLFDFTPYMDSTLHWALNLLIFPIVLILGLLFHEILHAIAWIPFASKGLKSIRMGVLKETMTPYCHCNEPLRIKHYLIGALTPAFVLGVLPLIFAFITGYLPVFIFGLLLWVGATGDFMITHYLLKENDLDAWVQDHPSEPGYYILKSVDGQ